MTENERIAYQIAVDHFRHDLVAFWNHSTFFALLQGALISVAVTSLGPQEGRDTVAILDAEELASLISVAGIAFGVFWAVVAWRRARLIQEWRQQVLHLDGRVNRHGMYLRIEPNVSTYWWYGPTTLTVALPYVVLSIWIVVIAVVWLGSLLNPVSFLVLAAWVGSVVWSVVRVRSQRSEQGRHPRLGEASGAVEP